MSETEVKPTREELLQRLKNKKKQVELHRMTKKNRETTLEKLETKAKSEQEEMMNQLKKCTPEQLKAFGLNEEMISQLLKNNQVEGTEGSEGAVGTEDLPKEIPTTQPVNSLQDTSCQTPLDPQTKTAIDNIFDIPNIHIPKMTAPSNKQNVNTI
jgi:hypothetical protein